MTNAGRNIKMEKERKVFMIYLYREEKDKAIKSLKDEVRELRDKEEEKLEEEKKKVLDKIKKEVTVYQEEKMADLKKDNEKVGFTLSFYQNHWMIIEL